MSPIAQSRLVSPDLAAQSSCKVLAPLALEGANRGVFVKVFVFQL